MQRLFNPNSSQLFDPTLSYRVVHLTHQRELGFGKFLINKTLLDNPSFVEFLKLKGKACNIEIHNDDNTFSIQLPETVVGMLKNEAGCNRCADFYENFIKSYPSSSFSR